MPKSKHYTMGTYDPTPEEKDAYDYCVKNNIRISPRGIHGQNKWYVEVYAKGKWNRSPEKYGPGEVWEVFYNYCKYYYAKKKEN